MPAINVQYLFFLPYKLVKVSFMHDIASMCTSVVTALTPGKVTPTCCHVWKYTCQAGRLKKNVCIVRF